MELETDEDAPIWLLIRRQGMRLLRIGCIYREQSQQTKVRSNFMGRNAAQVERWGRILNKWETNPDNYDTVVIEDLNLHILKWGRAEGLLNYLVDMMKTRIVTKGYFQKIQGITHHNHGRTADSLIDRVWVNDHRRFVEALNIKDLAFDNNPIMVRMNITYVKDKVPPKQARNFKN